MNRFNLDLDAIRVPGSPSIDEMLAAREPKAKPVKKFNANAALAKIEHLVGNLMAIYDLAWITTDPEARRDLLKGATSLSLRIVATRREYEFDRHEATIRDLNRQAQELKEVAASL